MLLPFGMEQVKLFFLLGFLLVALIVILFSMLYSSRTSRATKEIGLHSPSYIIVLLKVSIGIATLTAVLIVIFILTGYY